MSNTAKYIAALAIVIAIISLGILIKIKPPTKAKAQDSGIIGNQNQDIGGNFILHDLNGNIVDSSKFHDKYLLLYFGFTFCPDICPASLLEMTQTLKFLDSDADKIQAIFISIDPKRDTPEQLKLYFLEFDPRILPLTGSESELAKVADKFKVYYAVAPESKGDQENYMINHSSFFYLIDPSGKLVKYYDSKSAATTMPADIKQYLHRE